MSNQKKTQKSLDFQILEVTPSKDKYGEKETIRNICQQCLERHEKWKLAQNRGYSICLSLENLLKRSFQSAEASENHYSVELLKMCDNLRIITSVFEDLTKNLQQAIQRIQSLKNLNGNEDRVLYGASYTFDDVISRLKIIQAAYSKEYQVKKVITENAAHARSVNELVLNTSVWQFPVYANQIVDVEFLQLKFIISCQ